LRGAARVCGESDEATF